MFCAIWLCRYAPVVWRSQTATISSLVLSAIPYDAVSPRLSSEYSDQFLDDHDLAILRRREHNEHFSQWWDFAPRISGGRAGLAVGVAFVRGLARELSDTLGNFWADLTPPALDLVAGSIDRCITVGLAGRPDELPPLCRRHNRRGYAANHTARSGSRT